MRMPIVRGIIDRRILANYRIDAEAMARILPAPFRPKLVQGYAIGGICLIRLKNIRPRFSPLPWGIQSENAAHRIAVEWDVDGQAQEGVFIPRRDSDSRLNTMVGGRIFPVIHYHASFAIQESEQNFSVTMDSDDGDTHVHVSGKVTDKLPASSVFSSVSEVSEFFERGSLGYSLTHTPLRYDGLQLQCTDWRVEPLDVDRVESSYFENEAALPKGSVSFDCALLMRNIDHEWHSREDLCCPSAPPA
jgi:hypothetical protein